MRHESGFTLVELLIAIAIAGFITSLLGMGTYQLVTVTRNAGESMVAMHELQNAAHWLSLDGQQAQAASDGSQLTLTLPDGSLTIYALVGTELRRTSGGSQMTLARNISDLSFSVEDRVVSMSITSSPDGVDRQATHKVYLRPAEGVGP